MPLNLFLCRSNSSPPEIELSSQALAARGSVLRSALETLTSPTQRRDYDERLRLGESREEVPSEYLAGVLCLMFEAGNWQAVLTVGEYWLSSSTRNHRSVRDVAILTALSHREIAKQLALQQTVAETHAMLEVAAKILSIHKARDTELFASIQAEADSLRPQLTIQLLSSHDPSTRAKGVSALPWAIESFKTKVNHTGKLNGALLGKLNRQNIQAEPLLNRAQFFDQLRRLLSAEEYATAFEAAQAELRNDEFSADELYKAAIAYIAVGTLGPSKVGRPLSIRRAIAVLDRAERVIDAQTSSLPQGETGQQAMLQARKLMDERRKYAVAMAVCHVLLGQNSKAIECIGLHDGRPRCDRQVFAFIRSNSPSPSDPLPGLLVLVNMWIVDVVTSAFGAASSLAVRNGDDRNVVFSLDAWFASPEVLREISTDGDAPSDDSLHRFSKNLQRLSAGISSIITSFFTNELSSHQPSIDQTISASSSKNEDLALNAGGGVGISEDVTYGDGPRTDLQGTLDELELEPEGEEEEEEDFSTKLPVALKDIQTLRGEDDWMRSAYEARSVRWGRVASLVLFLSGILLLLLPSVRQFTNLRGLFGQSGSTPAGTSTTTSIKSTAAQAVISHAEATKLVSRWQKVKASALGPKHDVETLNTVLAGDLLTQWTDKAAALARQDVFYTHKLLNSKVTMVQPGSRDGTSTLKAEFMEEVTAHKTSELQKFTSKYEVVYTAEMFGQTWKLTSAQVLAL
jgi:hypothetical protein